MKISRTGLRACALLLLASPTITGAEVAPLPPPKHGGVYVVAHRGAHDGIPENTLAAYRRAIELGADFVEIDLRTTKDGELVSIHNDTVDAYVDDVRGRVADMTLEALRALDLGARFGPEYAGERIPTFEEILALCKGKIGIYLDMKHADAAQALALIRKYDMERHVLWYAGAAQLSQVVALCPECIPMPDPGVEALLPMVLERHKPRVVAAVWRGFSKTFVETCHAAGAIVIVDESDPSCWEQALAWGADGIQTDHPAELIAFLEKRARE
ncbi:MAG TPA: glycerophosphodiester phosphodiesterase family protein [Candidatus Hydrogenedentes bacterium]|nr:glycerophosphodiester phosphodiesterase family protein [Candidatus Hydrogenedentota bacterium]HNT88895.1 glycerophosphodiester phosphodiesterase family protein [Candidatus Hydrogenedentota bacterium]